MALSQYGHAFIETRRTRESSSFRPTRVVLYTDTYNGVDDQFAVTHAVLSPDTIDLKAIYAAPFYNKRSNGPKDGMEKSYPEIQKLLARLGAADDLAC